MMAEVIQTVRNLRSAKGFLSEKMAPTKAEGSKSRICYVGISNTSVWIIMKARMGVGRDESGETRI